MTEDFLMEIEGLRSEDLTTEVLSFILREEGYKPFQKLFFSFFLGKYPDEFFRIFRTPVLIDTRKTYTKGTPDLIIDNQKDTVILIENKFYANLSGADQISRYKTILANDYKTYANKYLILLTVKHRRCFYEEEIKKDLSTAGMCIKTTEELQDYLKVEHKINFKFLFWEDILELFNCEDIVIKSLHKYISHYFIGEVKFMEKDIAILKDTAFITAYKKIFAQIDRIRQAIHSEEYDVWKAKASQSINFYGFTIQLKNCSVWFGYSLLTWTAEGTTSPVILQFRREWYTGMINDKAEFDKKLLSVFQEPHKELEFVKFYPLEIFADTEKMIQQLDSDLKFMSSLT